jgi:hypothetical protein
MASALQELLERYATTKLCLADWERALGLHYPTLKACLIPSVGEVSTSYPATMEGLRYSVAQRGKGFMGFVREDAPLYEMEDIHLHVEELQLYALCPQKTQHHLGPMAPALASEKPVVRVTGDFAVLTLPDGQSFSLARKPKRRAFLRAVVRYCRTHETDLVPAQDVIDDYNHNLPEGEDATQAIRSSDVLYDLFKGQTELFKALFEIRDRNAALYRLQVTFSD